MPDALARRAGWSGMRCSIPTRCRREHQARSPSRRQHRDLALCAARTSLIAARLRQMSCRSTTWRRVSVHLHPLSNGWFAPAVDRKRSRQHGQGAGDLARRRIARPSPAVSGLAAAARGMDASSRPGRRAGRDFSFRKWRRIARQRDPARCRRPSWPRDRRLRPAYAGAFRQIVAVEPDPTNRAIPRIRCGPAAGRSAHQRSTIAYWRRGRATPFPYRDRLCLAAFVDRTHAGHHAPARCTGSRRPASSSFISKVPSLPPCKGARANAAGQPADHRRHRLSQRRRHLENAGLAHGEPAPTIASCFAPMPGAGPVRCSTACRKKEMADHGPLRHRQHAHLSTSA